MQTDYIDVLLIHFPDKNTPFEETMRALDTVLQQGKVRAVGVSNFTLDQLKECQATLRIDVVQYHFNMFDRRMEQEIFPYCQQQGIGVMVWGPLGVGLLSGTFTADTKFADHDYRGRSGGSPGVDGGMFAAEHWQRNLRLVDDLKPIAESRGKTMPQLALRWVLSNPAVSVALVGTLNNQELEENLGVLDWALSGEDMRQIDEVFAKYGVDTYPPKHLAGIPQIKPTFLEIAPSGIPSNIIPHSKGVKCGLIRSNSPFSYSNHRPAKPKIPKPLVYAQVSPLGTSFATP